MNCTRKLAFFASSTMFFLLVSSSASAATIALSELLDGESIQSGDKIFSDFSYVKTEDMPAPDAVNVITIQDGNGDYGIRFQGAFVDHPGGSPSDALITFKVTVADAGRKIVGATMAANTLEPSNEGLSSVAETFLPDVVVPGDQLYVSSDTALFDTVHFMMPMSSMMIQKNILLSAGGQNSATLSFIDQTFMQIPEPSGVAAFLAAIAMLPLTVIRRR